MQSKNNLPRPTPQAQQAETPQQQPASIPMHIVHHPVHTVHVSHVAQPGYYPAVAPGYSAPYGAPMPPPPPYGLPANPYAGDTSSARPPPPSVTLVAPSGQLVQQNLFEGKAGGKQDKDGAYTDYMNAVTSGLPGIDLQDSSSSVGMPGVELREVSPRNAASFSGSNLSLTQHE